MLTTYRDHVCLVTGASSGIGAAFACELAKRGAHVVLFARRADRLAEVAAALPSDHLVVVGDITQAADRARLVEATLARFGRIDVLINNAGRGDGAASFLKLDATAIEQVMQINLVSAIHLTHAIVPHMVSHQRGLIINVSSPMGQSGVPGTILYNTSKAGLSEFSQTLGRELKKHGIHVMDFRPGFTYSEMITPERAKRLPRIAPVKTAAVVVSAALDAALRGKAELMTGGTAVRLGVWLNRWLPRVVDVLIRQVERRNYIGGN